MEGEESLLLVTKGTAVIPQELLSEKPRVLKDVFSRAKRLPEICKFVFKTCCLLILFLLFYYYYFILP